MEDEICQSRRVENVPEIEPHPNEARSRANIFNKQPIRMHPSLMRTV